MHAIAFDLEVADTEQHHPKGVAQAYTEIGTILAEFGFRRVQGSLYVTPIVRIWRSCFWPFRPCVLAPGFPSRCVIFAPSALSSGRISPPW